METAPVPIPAAGDETARPSTPFVLVHGFADTAATWDPLVPLLEPYGPVHRWDLPGHGARADDPAQLMSRDAAVAELADRISELAQPVTLVGHSFGGYLALTLVIRRPELVSSLVLVDSGPGFRDTDARRRWNDYMDAVATKNRMPVHVAILGHQPDSLVIDQLGSIRCRVLHVIGAEDTRYLAGANYLRKVLPSSRLIPITGGGHHPQVARPTDVADAILAHRSAVSSIDVEH